MEVYIDDMITKSVYASDHAGHLRDTFNILRTHQMRLNIEKCAFKSPSIIKEVQSLAGQIAALSRFISKATDWCKPFLKALKAGKKLQWTAECEEAFQKLKEYLFNLLLLAKLKPREVLLLYLTVSEHATSSLLLIEDKDGVQRFIYYTSRAMAHTIAVVTNLPLRQIFQKLDIFGRLLRWSLALSEFDIIFKPRSAIKARTIADFITEFANDSGGEEILGYPSETTPAIEEEHAWKIYNDGSSNSHGSGVGVIIINPGEVKPCYALQFGFKASNNEAEYEAIIARLRMSKALGAKMVRIKSDSQFVVSQINSEYQANEENMKGYLGRTRELISQFAEVKMEKVPQLENFEADNLAKMASFCTTQSVGPITIEYIPTLNVNLPKLEEVGSITAGVPWMQLIIRYLKSGDLPSDKSKVRRLKYKAAQYCLIDD
ncbi:uncharacterized protein LOC127899248 [Citrus sinensis]|uniref:uncharacterized protein LOC112096290 n=1 Tax=Citrus clementina TaxID=85681 RepID=UPI000CED1BF5|nr:uncharacterized protein LOC112096290 [Citrus x clementina]XP_052288546.1 uncharacterized protein LOC127899248 [Citrus sinensis]